jgi:phenylpropionate dioxygenase-like ring-hydroxylating dioxygenase large terminal subunit
MTPADPDATLSLARRALAHFRAGTTDMAPGLMRQPLAAYTDPDRYAQELDRIFRRLPLGLALSVDLPGPNAYMALEAAGVPVLIVRGDDGVARAFLNSCRHRGAPVCPAGKGERRRFVCPYHSWAYDSRGALKSVYDEHTFGPIDKATMGLVALPTAEAAGIVWVALTPEAAFDIDDWLDGFRAELEALHLADWHIHDQRSFPGPGWKVAWDGYLEAYHHNPIHGQTVGKYTIGNLLVHDTFGPHQRLVFGRKSLAEIGDRPEPAWQPEADVRKIHSVFPNLSISGVLGDHCLVSLLLPGPTPDRTTTRQTVLAAKRPETEAERAASDSFSRLVLQAVVDEDYAIGATIQAGLGTHGMGAFVYGRNEPALQHYHTTVARLAGTPPPEPLPEPLPG